MLEFTKEIYTAINLICLLNDKPASTDDLAKTLGVTKSVILNLTPKLSKMGLIISSRGRGGGITAGKARVTLYDVFEVFYGRGSTNLTSPASEVHWLMVEALKSVDVKVNYAQKYEIDHSKNENDIPEGRMDEWSEETKAAVKAGLEDVKAGRVSSFEPAKEDLADEVLDEVDDGFTW